MLPPNVEMVVPVFCTAILSSSFFWIMVLLDKTMEKRVSVYSRVAISHVIIFFIILVVLYLLPGRLAEWGVNLGHWQTSLTLGIILGLTIGVVFSLFSHGTNITHWSVTGVITQLKDKQNLVHLLSQIFLIGLSEELFFRGLLVTYLMKQYSVNLIGLHIAVIIVSVMFASVHFYKLLLGAKFGKILPFVIGGFFYGLVLGWLYQETGSLIGPVALHNLGNSCMFLISIGIPKQIQA